MPSLTPPVATTPLGAETTDGAPASVEREHKLSFERWIPVVVAVLIGAPVVLAAYPPMTDLPHHEALVALLRTMGDASRFPPGFYVRNLGHPNQLFHLLAWPLTFVVSPTLASKLVAALAVGVVPLGVGRLSRHLGLSPALSLLGVPVALGWIFNWGFVNNLLGLGLLLAFLPGLDRYVKKPTVPGFVFALAGTLVLYIAHELMMLVFVGACGLFALLAPYRSGRIFRDGAARIAPAAVALVVAGVQLVLQEHLKTATVSGVRTVFISPLTKLIGVPITLVGGPAAFPKYVVFGLWVASAALFRRVGHSRGNEPAAGASLVARLAPRRFVVLAAAVFGLFLIAPFSFNGAILVHQRFLAPAALIGVLALAAGPLSDPVIPSSPGPLPLALACVLPVAMLLVVWPDFVDSSANYVAVGKLLDRIPNGASVAAVDIDQDQGGRVFSVASAQSRVLARSGGRVLYSFTDSPVAPVRIAPAYQWNEPAARVMLDNLSFRPEHDMTRFGFLLVHATRASDMEITAGALAPFARQIMSSGEWGLFESRLEVVPITSPDVPLPTPHPHTLRYLRHQILDQLRNSLLATPDAAH